MVKPPNKDDGGKKKEVSTRCCVPPTVFVCPHTVDCELSERTAIRMKCSNPKCPIPPFAHMDCFRKLEEELLKLLERVHVRANVNKWKDHQRETMLWVKCYDLVYKHCR